jgi:hypothetical protein
LEQRKTPQPEPENGAKRRIFALGGDAVMHKNGIKSGTGEQGKRIQGKGRDGDIASSLVLLSLLKSEGSETAKWQLCRCGGRGR